MLKEKLKAFTIHFLLSLFVISLCFTLVRFIWYPGPFLKMQGGLHIIIIIICVDLIIGPLLTSVIYKKGKKGLLFDLIFIACIQITALLYGLNTLYQERPLYIAFNVDRFNLVSSSDIDWATLNNNTFNIGLFEQAKLVYVELPQSSELRAQISIEAFSGGKDFYLRPEYYKNYETHIKKIASSTYQLSIDNVTEHYPDIQNTLKTEQFSQLYSIFPIQGKKQDILVVLNKNNGTISYFINKHPWLTQKKM